MRQHTANPHPSADGRRRREGALRRRCDRTGGGRADVIELFLWQVAEGSPTRLLDEDSGDPDDADAVWVLTFPMPVLSLPPAEGDGEEENAGKKKKKGKAKVKVRPVWFDVSVDGGQNWFSTANDEDVHIQVKDPLP